MDCIGLSCTNSGNNTNWTFVAAATPSPGPSKASGNAAEGLRFLREHGFLADASALSFSQIQLLQEQIRQLQLQVIDLSSQIVRILQQQVSAAPEI